MQPPVVYINCGDLLTVALAKTQNLILERKGKDKKGCIGRNPVFCRIPFEDLALIAYKYETVWKPL